MVSPIWDFSLFIFAPDIDRGYMDTEFLHVAWSQTPFGYMYMGQNLQDGKKVLQMSQLDPRSKSCPAQTIDPSNLGFYVLQ